MMPVLSAQPAAAPAQPPPEEIVSPPAHKRDPPSPPSPPSTISPDADPKPTPTKPHVPKLNLPANPHPLVSTIAAADAPPTVSSTTVEPSQSAKRSPLHYSARPPPPPPPAQSPKPPTEWRGGAMPENAHFNPAFDERCARGSSACVGFHFPSMCGSQASAHRTHADEFT
jgi:hypothetical protein